MGSATGTIGANILQKCVIMQSF